MIGGNQYEHKNASLSSTLTQPLTKGTVGGISVSHKKSDSNYKTPLREKVKSIQRPLQFNGNGILRYN